MQVPRCFAFLLIGLMAAAVSAQPVPLPKSLSNATGGVCLKMAKDGSIAGAFLILSTGSARKDRDLLAWAKQLRWPAKKAAGEQREVWFPMAITSEMTRPAGLPKTCAPSSRVSAVESVPIADSALKPVAPRPGQTRFEGWVAYRGEVMLYDTRRSMADERKAPHCISGVPPVGSALHLAGYEGQRVIITGKLVGSATLPYEARPFLPRRILAGRVIHNFCLGEQVILIERIERG